MSESTTPQAASTTPQAALGELLDEARHEAGHSLRDLAKRACRVLIPALFLIAASE